MDSQRPGSCHPDPDDRDRRIQPRRRVEPGTYCTVELKIPRRTPSLIVPAGAIVVDRDGLHVLVVENGVAHSRKITEIRD